MSMTEILGPPCGYVDLLNHYTAEKLKQDHSEGKHFQKTPIRPSAAGKCSRELFHELKQYHGLAKYDTEVDEPELHRIFGLGHGVEYHVVKQFELLSEIFELRYKQQVLSFKFLEAKNNSKLSQWLEGSLDLVFWSDKYKCVADIKSKKDKFSAGFKSNWDETTEKLTRMGTVLPIGDAGTSFWVDNLPAFLDELNDPFFEANFLQLNLYANSDFLKERGVNHGAIIQYNKNDSRIREIRFRPSETLYIRTLKKFQDVITAVDTDNPDLAPQDYALGSIKCAFCKFKRECWGGTNTLKAYFETFPPKKWPTDTKRMGNTGKALERAFAVFLQASQAEQDKARAEQEIARLMALAKVNKVRLQNGEVYEAKQLKERVSIRRSKP